ncbi:YgdI/YgdR family lipoprotein [[Erwinia] mediterraneensis]|uniref:YgdI/YgdR family lipoprotein n=1 Tax=[Erwinia] mediterraneensis TaxID=2161819 RepID=UPI0010314075|nr:YgdI/YgdR family lipoprotein [[Erwinia] mediterraneensis]
MKKRQIAAGLLLVISISMLSACSSDYAIQTNDGRTIITSGKPNIDDETGLIEYEDVSGLTLQINRDDVKTMTKIN